MIYWTPLYLSLRKEIRKNKGIILIICPFIQLYAIKTIIKEIDDYKELKIITRWKEEDVISGVSDINIYKFLKNNNIKLYINQNIHIKLLVFRNNLGFLMTGNITNRGIGISNINNVEGGIVTELNKDDWSRILNIINESIEVDDYLYCIYKEYLKENKNLIDLKLPIINIKYPINKEFSIFNLPVLSSPEEMYMLYKSINEIINIDKYRMLLHDMTIFNIDFNLSKNVFFACLNKAFINYPFIKAIIEFLKRKNEPIRFGSLKKWLQDNCSDKPVPYMYELTNNAQVLYKWLSFFYFNNIKITRPRYSQLIEWVEGEKNERY